MTYGVLHRKTGKWFGGFDNHGCVIWTDEEEAQAMDFGSAKLQAALFLSSACSENVQRKPRALK